MLSLQEIVQTWYDIMWFVARLVTQICYSSSTSPFSQWKVRTDGMLYMAKERMSGW